MPVKHAPNRLSSPRTKLVIAFPLVVGCDPPFADVLCWKLRFESIDIVGLLLRRMTGGHSIVPLIIVGQRERKMELQVVSVS